VWQNRWSLPSVAPAGPRRNNPQAGLQLRGSEERCMRQSGKRRPFGLVRDNSEQAADDPPDGKYGDAAQADRLPLPTAGRQLTD